MFENIRCDIIRHDLHQCFKKHGLIVFIARWMAGYGIQAVVVYRYGQWVEKQFCYLYWFPLKWCFLLPYWAANWLIVKLYGIRISKKAQIGAGFYVGHFGGIEVGECRIGKNCSIQQNVKILSAGNPEGPPRVGSYVWVGAHARIKGGITIADRVTIAAGAIVTRDIASGCLASGNPVRVIKNYDNSEILGKII